MGMTTRSSFSTIATASSAEVSLRLYSSRQLRRRLSNAAGAVVAAVAGIPRPRISVGQVLLLGIALIVIAYVFGDSFGSRSIVRLFIISGIVLFIGAFIFSLRRQSASRLPEKRWRGQPVGLGPGGGPPR